MTHTTSDPTPMTADHAVNLINDFESAQIPVWIGGGWGIDALVGRQTREHRDLDLMYPIEHDSQLRAILKSHGYEPETDWWPARVEYAGTSYVDVHPLRFKPDGSAVQSGLGDATFVYPASAFTRGSVNGRSVGCLSAAQQREFHTGYELRAVDHHDLALLADLPSQ